MKRYLFILRAAPHSGCHVQEWLDMVLITAAFDQHTALLFADHGVFQIKCGQHALEHKDTAAIFRSLELYGVRDIFVEAESLVERGLHADDLLLPVTVVPRAEMVTLMQNYDVVTGS